MVGSVGEVYYDVLPNLDRFAGEVAAKLGRQKPVKIPVEVDTAKAVASTQKLTAQTAQLTTGSARLAAAQGRVRVAGAALNEVRAKATAGSARLIAAEERYANAIRGVKTVQESEARQAARVAAARQAAGVKTAQAAERAAAREQAARAKAAAAEEKATARSVANRRQAQQQLGTGLVAGGAAAAVALGAMVKVTADFEQAVSGVASTGAEARGSIGALREEAIRYGASTSFSAREAANAQEALIKANVAVRDTINGGLKGALDLAAAGSLGVADAAGIMGTALSQFKLEGTQASHVADLLAAGAGKAQGEVQDFAEALKYVGPVAQSAGVGIEETVGALAEFANQGILGSQAGTSLRSIFLSLTAPVGQGAQAMKIYGINTRDASGQFIGLGAAAGELRKKLGNLTQEERDAALARIFGKNALTAATILYNEGAAGVEKWTKAVSESGYAQDVARTKMDNLKGDLEQLGGAFQSAFIDTAAGTQLGARTAVQAVTGIVDAYNQLPAAGKNLAFIGAGLAAATAIGVGGTFKLVGALRAAKEAAAALNFSLKGVGIAGGAVTIGIAAAAAVIGHYAIKAAESKQRTDDLTQALLQSKGAIDGNVASMRAKSLEDSGALIAANKLGISIDDLTKASLGNADAQARVNAILDVQAGKGQRVITSANGQRIAYDNNAKAIDTVRDAVAGGNKELERSIAAYGRQKAAAEAAAGGAKGLTGSLQAQQNAAASATDQLDSMGGAAKPTTESINALSTALWGNATAALAAVDAEVAYQAAIDQTAATAKKNKGKGLNTDKESGRENTTALRNQAAASQAYVDSLIKQGKSSKRVGEATADARKEFIKNATVMTGSAKKAEALADKYGLIPKKVETKVETQIKADRQAKIDKLADTIKTFPKSVRSEVITLAKAGKFDQANAKVKEYKKSLKSIPGNVNVDAKVKPTGVPKTKSTIKGIKGTEVDAKVKPTGIPSTQRQIKGIKGTTATVKVEQTGASAVQRTIYGIKGSTVYVKIMEKKMRADGGTLDVPGHAYGGTIRGVGGPREDNIAIMDRANGRQMAWGSVGEEMVNARQSALNRAQIKQINRGGKWDLIPRHADGGTLAGAGAVAQQRSAAHRTLTLMLDMGPIFGGVQQLVLDLQDDRDEYAATVGRMH